MSYEIESEDLYECNRFFHDKSPLKIGKYILEYEKTGIVILISPLKFLGIEICFCSFY